MGRRVNALREVSLQGKTKPKMGFPLFYSVTKCFRIIADAEDENGELRHAGMDGRHPDAQDAPGDIHVGLDSSTPCWNRRIFARSFENWATVLHPSCILPIEGRSESKPFPSTGKEPALRAAEGLDRGESLLQMPPFSSSAGERKTMIQFVLNRKTLIEYHGIGCAANQWYDNSQ
jgi:hypothetical protein